MINNYPVWKTWAWRLVRGAVATAVAQTLATQVDWSNPQIAERTLAISFVTGFLMALSLAIRDQFGGDNKVSAIHKLPI